MTKFESQGLHIIRIKYWNASGSGFPPCLIPALWNIGILLHKQATLGKHFRPECMYFFLHFSEAAATEILDNAIAVGEASGVDTDKKDEDLNFDEQVNNYQKVSFLYRFYRKIWQISH